MTPHHDEKKQEVVAELRRSQIMGAAVRLFGEKGFEATHMQDIAKAADLAKGTVYFYFESKDAIYLAALGEAFAGLNTMTEERVSKATTFRGKIAAFVGVRIEYWSKHSDLYRMILTWTYDTQLRERKGEFQVRTTERLRTIFLAAIQSGELPDQDCETAAWATLDIVRGFIERRVIAKVPLSEKDDETLTTLVLNLVGASRISGRKRPGVTS